MFDINTIDDLVDAFGGASKLGHLLGIGDTAVHNWSARGFIPPSWHLRLYVDLRKMGRKANPELFELDGENASVLYPEHSVAA
jgi:hypothetical protein